MLLMGRLVLLRMSIKHALKHLTCSDFKQHKRGLYGTNIGLSLNGKRMKDEILTVILKVKDDKAK